MQLLSHNRKFSAWELLFELPLIIILHCKYFFLFIQIFIFNNFFSWLLLFKFFYFGMKTFAFFNYRNPSTSYEFYQSIRLKRGDQPVCFFSMPGCFKNRKILSDSNDSCAKLVKQSFYFCFFCNNICWYFIQGHFLPDNFIICVVICF